MMALALSSLGHDVVTAVDGLAGLTATAEQRPDVVVLDVMMPSMDGFEVCRRLRASSHVPIIMLTARGDAIDVVAGLECGADDYVTKPVEPRVLEARLKALLRRASVAADEEPSSLLIVGGLLIDADALVVSRDGHPIDLTATELKLLLCLARNAGQVMTRGVLLDRVWDYGYEGDSRLVDATIQRLRAKVEPDPAHPTYIKTARGFGYKLERP